ncbi:hypothetical protein GBF38_022335 [Nibea albiflora]|uniref:Uncharacterized protein n=1 Tax=Nibea albiflora TaxID=240163 RepID=A0ACB7FHG6_NIBAL|nr:hypothetical protein GBF38_022335 [Nibea albiflora]
MRGQVEQVEHVLQAPNQTQKQKKSLMNWRGLVKSLMQAQMERDQQREKEASRQEQRWKRMQQQVSQMQQQVNMMTEEQRTELDTMDEIYRPQRIKRVVVKTMMEILGTQMR